MKTRTIGLAALGLLGTLALGGCAGGVEYGYGDPYGPGFYGDEVGVGFGYGYGFDPYHHRDRFDRFGRGRYYGRSDFRNEGRFIRSPDGRRGRIIIPRAGRGGFGGGGGGFGGGRGGLGSGSSKG